MKIEIEIKRNGGTRKRETK